MLYDIQGDSSRSLAEYKLAIEAEPKNPDVFSDLGYYYFKRENLSDAERELRKALEIDPKHAKALTNLGMVLAGEKRFDESFAGLFPSRGARRGPFECRRALGQTRPQRRGPQAISRGPGVGLYAQTTQGVSGVSRPPAVGWDQRACKHGPPLCDSARQWWAGIASSPTRCAGTPPPYVLESSDTGLSDPPIDHY